MDGVTLLDGGMGQELLRAADAEPSPLWSAQVMIDQPELVERIHREYIVAGADVITVNTYSATRCRLGPAGREHDYEALQRRACELATAARGDRADVSIAGSLSPYGWSYHPELAPPFDELWPAYAETASIQAPYVDLVICETMGSIEEARGAVRGAAETGLPIWLAWSLRDDDSITLRSGEPLTDALAAIRWFDGAEHVEAILLNCSTPETITAAMATLASADRPFGAYANGFTHIAAEFGPGTSTDLLGVRHDVGPSEYADTVEGWTALGASIVGGCCEIGPRHIAELARRLGHAELG